MDNWEKYYHLDRPDPLVQLAIIHGQFEVIHPFLDGNGRLGRMIVPLFLHEKCLLSRPMFYISAYLEEHRGSWPKIAEESGVTYTWMTKIVQGNITNPGIRDIQKLLDYIAEH